jgi:hypothetical protein
MLVSSATPEPAKIDSTFLGFTPNVSDSTITFTITGVVQSWTAKNHTYDNNGFVLQMTGENQTIARLALYSSRGDPNLEPKVHITYSTTSSQ